MKKIFECVVGPSDNGLFVEAKGKKYYPMFFSAVRRLIRDLSSEKKKCLKISFWEKKPKQLKKTMMFLERETYGSFFWFKVRFKAPNDLAKVAIIPTTAITEIPLCRSRLQEIANIGMSEVMNMQWIRVDNAQKII